MDLVAFRISCRLIAGYSGTRSKSFRGQLRRSGTASQFRGRNFFSARAIPARSFPVAVSRTRNAAGLCQQRAAAPPADMSLHRQGAGPSSRRLPDLRCSTFFTPVPEGPPPPPRPDYIYLRLLTGYQEPPERLHCRRGTYFNPYFVGGPPRLRCHSRSTTGSSPIDERYHLRRWTILQWTFVFPDVRQRSRICEERKRHAASC